jgi:hypothetical protein
LPDDWESWPIAQFGAELFRDNQFVNDMPDFRIEKRSLEKPGELDWHGTTALFDPAQCPQWPQLWPIRFST